MGRRTKGIALTAAVVGISGAYYYYLNYGKKNKETIIPKGVKLRFDLTVSQIEALTQEILKQWEAVEDLICAIPRENISFANTAGALARWAVQRSSLITNVTFLAHVSPDKDIREACNEAQKALNAYDIKSMMRVDVYNVLVALDQKLATDNEAVSAEGRRYVSRLLRDARRNGLHLPEHDRDSIASSKQQMSSLKIEFQKNLVEEDVVLHFSKDELDGLTSDFFDSLDYNPETKTFDVPLKYPQVFPILKRATNPDTRKAVEYAFNRRCIDRNVEILESLVSLRHEVATVLGFDSHADYVLNVRMAASTETVSKFLHDLNDKLQPLAKKELDTLLRLKEAECAESEREFDGLLHLWDFRYYMEKFEKQTFDVDQDLIREYFPLNVVTKKLLGIYQELLELTYTKVPNAQTWHSEVEMYAVHDAKSSRLIGYFYLDLFPRPGKYGHAACFGLQPGCEDVDKSRQLPVAAMVANFTAPTATKPSLLNHREVVTYFHEFGHVMHQVCTEVTFRHFSGTAVERDFVEAPSQMLENWCWEPVALARLSGHYLDNSRPLPADEISKLVATRNANAGLLNKRQLLFAMFDQAIHASARSGSEKVDTEGVLAQLHSDILLIDMTPGTNFASSFGHLAGGYDAQYYGYLWSEVYSMDMFQTKFKASPGDLMSPKVGREYRDCILAKGGSEDAIDMLKNFLGREPNDNAFLKSKGL